MKSIRRAVLAPVFALVGSVGIAVLLAAAFTPLHWLPQGRVHMYIDTGCPAAEFYLSALETDRALAERIIPVPLSADGGVNERACNLARAALETRAIWFALTSDGWLCGELASQASRVYEAAHAIELPAFFIGLTEIPGDELELVLGTVGIELRNGRPHVFDAAKTELRGQEPNRAVSLPLSH